MDLLFCSRELCLVWALRLGQECVLGMWPYSTAAHKGLRRGPCVRSVAPRSLDTTALFGK